MNQERIKEWNSFKEQVGEDYKLYHLNRNDLDEKEMLLFDEFSFRNDYTYTNLKKGFSIGSKRKTIRVYLLEASYRSGVNDIVEEGTPAWRTIEKDYQILGAVQTKKDYQKVVIQPKRLIHRIQSVFHRTPASLKDFQQKYSKKLSTYYKNEEDVLRLMEKGVFEEIMNQPKYTIELNRRWFMVNTKKKFDLESAHLLVSFLMRVYERGI